MRKTGNSRTEYRILRYNIGGISGGEEKAAKKAADRRKLREAPRMAGENIKDSGQKGQTKDLSVKRQGE